MAEWKRVITGVAEALDELDDYESNFIEVRDKIVAIFKADPAYEDYGADDFSEAVSELEVVDTRSYFDLVLGAIYDWADAERVWIEPRRVPSMNLRGENERERVMVATDSVARVIRASRSAKDGGPGCKLNHERTARRKMTGPTADLESTLAEARKLRAEGIGAPCPHCGQKWDRDYAAGTHSAAYEAAIVGEVICCLHCEAPLRRSQGFLSCPTHGWECGPESIFNDPRKRVPIEAGRDEP